MHSFVGAVLLGTAGQDPLMLNAQPHPAHLELREAVDARGSERYAIVSANGAGQSPA